MDQFPESTSSEATHSSSSSLSYFNFSTPSHSKVPSLNSLSSLNNLMEEQPLAHQHEENRLDMLLAQKQEEEEEKQRLDMLQLAQEQEEKQTTLSSTNNSMERPVVSQLDLLEYDSDCEMDKESRSQAIPLGVLLSAAAEGARKRTMLFLSSECSSSRMTPMMELLASYLVEQGYGKPWCAHYNIFRCPGTGLTSCHFKKEGLKMLNLCFGDMSKLKEHRSFQKHFHEEAPNVDAIYVVLEGKAMCGARINTMGFLGSELNLLFGVAPEELRGNISVIFKHDPNARPGRVTHDFEEFVINCDDQDSVAQTCDEIFTKLFSLSLDRVVPTSGACEFKNDDGDAVVADANKRKYSLSNPQKSRRSFTFNGTKTHLGRRVEKNPKLEATAEEEEDEEAEEKEEEHDYL